jgi:hypothetical protein
LARETRANAVAFLASSVLNRKAFVYIDSNFKSNSGQLIPLVEEKTGSIRDAKIFYT